MASAILSNSLGEYLFGSMSQGGAETLHELAFRGRLLRGASFIYNGHFYTKGFAASNKTTALSLHETLDEPLQGKKLVLEFSKNGLVNDTAYARLSRSVRLFTYGYITEIDSETIRAVPYIIGDLIIRPKGLLPLPLELSFALRPECIDQFSSMDTSWSPSKKEFGRLKEFPEHLIKKLLCDLLGEPETPKDWGGEESDLFSANLSINGSRYTAAFLLKGPAQFHRMTPADCGKNGDQIYRLFNIPAQVYAIQHCHMIGPAVRKTAEAFTLHRTFTSPCRYMLIDGTDTARLLRANNLW